VFLVFGLLASFPGLEDCWRSFNRRTGICNNHRDAGTVGSIVTDFLGYLFQIILFYFTVLVNSLAVGFLVGEHAFWTNWKVFGTLRLFLLFTKLEHFVEFQPFKILVKLFSSRPYYDDWARLKIAYFWIRVSVWAVIQLSSCFKTSTGINKTFQIFQNFHFVKYFCLATTLEKFSATIRHFSNFHFEKNRSTQSNWFVVEFVFFKRNQGFHDFTVSKFLDNLQTILCTILIGKLPNVVARNRGVLAFTSVTAVTGVQW
jgi:hypothetical protein